MRSANFFVLFGVTYGKECLAPSLGDQIGCAPCYEPELRVEKETQISLCARNDHYFQCYDGISECCSSEDIREHRVPEHCIFEYNHPSVCNKYVSKTSSYTNAECQADCEAAEASGLDPVNTSALQEKCMLEHFTVDLQDKVTPSGVCFDNWVYGHNEPGTLSGYKVIEEIPTPALCQAECQKDSACVRFLWSYDSVESGYAYDRAARCHLKNNDQVDVPLSIIYKDNMAATTIPSDEHYCSWGIGQNCLIDSYECAPCGDGVKRCVWKSGKHISGWKYCSGSDALPAKEQCLIPGIATTTTTEIPTTEIPTTEEMPTTGAITTRTTGQKGNTKVTVPRTASTTTTTEDPTITRTTGEKGNTKVTVSRTASTATTTEDPTTTRTTAQKGNTKVTVPRTASTATTTEDPTTTRTTARKGNTKVTVPRTASTASTTEDPTTTRTTAQKGNTKVTVPRTASTAHTTGQKEHTTVPRLPSTTTTTTSTESPTTIHRTTKVTATKTSEETMPEIPSSSTRARKDNTRLPVGSSSAPECDATTGCEGRVTTPASCDGHEGFCTSSPTKDCQRDQECRGRCNGDEHGMALRIHDQPKKLRIAVDN